jgi:hypothetical protein
MALYNDGRQKRWLRSCARSIFPAPKCTKKQWNVLFNIAKNVPIKIRLNYYKAYIQNND